MFYNQNEKKKIKFVNDYGRYQIYHIHTWGCVNEENKVLEFNSICYVYPSISNICKTVLPCQYIKVTFGRFTVKEIFCINLE